MHPLLDLRLMAILIYKSTTFGCKHFSVIGNIKTWKPQWSQLVFLKKKLQAKTIDQLNVILYKVYAPKVHSNGEDSLQYVIIILMNKQHINTIECRVEWKQTDYIYQLFSFLFCTVSLFKIGRYYHISLYQEATYFNLSYS